MRSQRRLMAGLCFLLTFSFITWGTTPTPAQSSAPAAQAGPASPIFDAIHFREIGPTAQGGRLRRVRRGRKQHASLLRRHRHWRPLENREQRHQRSRRCSTISLITPSARLPSHRAGPMSSTSAPASRTTRARPMAATAFTSRSTPARPGRNPACRTPAGSAGSSVNPKNPDIVLVAASGKLYSENPDRGLYRSTDGGRTWTKTLDHKVEGREIGAIDVADGSGEPQRALCRDLRQGAQALDVWRGGARQRDLQVDRRRRDLETAHQRAADWNARPHRHLDRAQRSEDRLRDRRERELADGRRRGATEAHDAGLRGRLDRRRALSIG